MSIFSDGADLQFSIDQKRNTTKVLNFCSVVRSKVQCHHSDFLDVFFVTINSGECSWVDCVGLGADKHGIWDSFTSGIATQNGDKTSEEMICLTTELFEAEGGWIVEMRLYHADQSHLLLFPLLQCESYISREVQVKLQRRAPTYAEANIEA